MLIEILYSSVASIEITDEVLSGILNKAQTHNKDKGVTGLLVYFEKTREFFQILEGEPSEVSKLMAKIFMDERHCSIKVLYEGEIETPSFSKWSMALKKIGAKEYFKLPGAQSDPNEALSDEQKLSRARRLFDYIKRDLF